MFVGLLFCVATATSAIEVQVILDSSKSMSLPIGEQTRFSLAQDTLARVIRDIGGDQLSLYLVSNGDELVPVGVFDADTESIRTALEAVSPSGRASPSRALDRVSSMRSDRQSDLTVLLVTDAEEVSPRWGPPPRFDQLHLLVIDGSTPPSQRFQRSLLPYLESLTIVEAGGTRRGVDLVGDATSVQVVPPAPQTEPTRERERSPFWIVILVVGALAGLVLLLFLAYLTIEHRRFLRLRERARQYNAVNPLLSLSVRGGGASEEAETRTYPFTIGFSATDDITLPLEVATDRFTDSDRISIAREDGVFAFSSTTDLRIGGILRSTGELHEGLQVRVGRTRLSVLRIEQRKVKREPRPYHYEKLPPAGIAAAVATAAVFGLMLIPEYQNPEKLALSAAEQSESASSGAARVYSSVRSAFSRRVAGTPVPGIPAVFAATEEIPFFDADFVAIHAHPDDESLDFGALLATLTASGRRGVQILLTDGDSGQDLYPDRQPRDGYPQRELRGAELAQIRVQEAARALSWLGVEHYIRIGLPNRPYNSILDEVSPREILAVWGGDASVAEELSRLIEGYEPELIISPDGPSDVIEHFEHDATGIAVARAVEIAQDRGAGPITHIVSIDPLQTDRSQDLYVLPAWEVAGHGVSTSARDRQLRALDAHLTQLDAHVDGVETRSGLLYEFYRVKPGTNAIRTLVPQLRPSGALR
jgi:LmbE family N-acetylglucosaminyl deacetylase